MCERFREGGLSSGFNVSFRVFSSLQANLPSLQGKSAHISVSRRGVFPLDRPWLLWEACRADSACICGWRALIDHISERWQVVERGQVEEGVCDGRLVRMRRIGWQVDDLRRWVFFYVPVVFCIALSRLHKRFLSLMILRGVSIVQFLRGKCRNCTSQHGERFEQMLKCYTYIYERI